MTRILNLGCGGDDYGTDRLDFKPGPTVTMVADMEHRLPYEDGTFDEVYSRYSFEHVRNPGSLLDEIRRVLRPGGVLRLITDNAWFWRTSLRISRSHERKEHYATYIPLFLKNHVESAGFEVATIGYTNWKRKIDILLETIGMGKLGAQSCYVVARKP